MGEVYLAEDTNLDRKVAIKFLSLDSAADPQVRRRILREAKAAAKLDHANICSIYEVSEESDAPFIVMQYVEGESLTSRIERKPIELTEALDISIQLSHALAHAHSRGVIHRDIKPQNIMMAASGQVRLLDFGLARLLREKPLLQSDAETESLLTAPGLLLGTLPYMSPEQVRGEPLDAQSDIFSFGVAAYEMLSGHRPFESESAAETMSAY